MFGASLEEGQRLSIYSYDVNVSTAEMDYLLTGEGDDYQSFDVIEASHSSLGKYSPTDTMVPMQVQAWSSVGQLDVLFISTDKYLKIKDEDGNEQEQSVFEQGLFYYMYQDLNALVADAIDYCERNAGFQPDGSYSTTAIASHFNKRKKGDNFLRKGLINAEMEIDRFEKIWQNATKLKALLDDESLDIWVVADRGESKDLVLGVDLGKLEAYGANDQTGKRIGQLCSFEGNVDEAGNTSASGVALTVLNNKAHQPELFYESLAFVVNVIETYSSL